MHWIIALMLLVMAGEARSESVPARRSRLGLLIAATDSMGTTELNERITAAVAAGAAWPKSPLRATLELFGDDEASRVVSLHVEANRGEGADMTVVEMEGDGFRDDSTRGSWRRIVYRRVSDATWRIVSVRSAWRCWRGAIQLQSYGITPCL